MTVTVTIRPSGARTLVSGLPYTGNPHNNYALLEDIIGASRRDQVQYQNGSWSTARHHTKALITGLADRFGHVHVIQYGGTTKCVEACWNAHHETAYLCECSCAGDNHGTGQPLDYIVADTGPAGALSVSPLPPRAYDVYGG